MITTGVVHITNITGICHCEGTMACACDERGAFYVIKAVEDYPIPAPKFKKTMSWQERRRLLEGNKK